MELNEEFRRLATRQHGYFTTQQANRCGYTRDLIGYYVKCGYAEKVDWALYRLAGSTDSLESEFVRWSLWVTKRLGGRQVIVSHNSALAFYALSLQDCSPVHFWVPPRRNKGDKPGCVFHNGILRTDEYVQKDGFAITTPYRTLLDMKPDLILNRKWMDTVRLALQKELLQQNEGAALLSGMRSGVETVIGIGGSAGVKGESMPRNHNSLFTANEGRSSNALAQEYQSKYSKIKRQGVLGSQSAFTLVELLVVISIIAILASLLMPAMVKAMSSARAVYCMNNLRQTGIGVFSYTNQFKDYGPAPLIVKVSPWRQWPDALMYSGSMENIATKLNSSTEYPLSTVPRTAYFQCPLISPPEQSYSASGITFSAGENCTKFSYGVRYMTPHSYKLSTEKISTEIAYLPKMSTLDKKLPFLGDSYCDSGSDYITQSNWLVYTFTSLTGWPAGGGGGIIHRRHNDCANLWFTGGNVKSMNSFSISALGSGTSLSLMSCPEPY